MNVNLVALVIAVASWGLAFFARGQTGLTKKTAKENLSLNVCSLYTCRAKFCVSKHEEYTKVHPRGVVCLVSSSRDAHNGTFVLVDKPDSGWYPGTSFLALLRTVIFIDRSRRPSASMVAGLVARHFV